MSIVSSHQLSSIQAVFSANQTHTPSSLIRILTKQIAKLKLHLVLNRNLSDLKGSIAVQPLSHSF